ncbi:MAG: hypothetical protein KJ880_04050 [Candidatus Omnitrophica bacterium]|nr:hypothetical protein [Candidatus Omnitrophota bacterium]MBU1870150.1 hypothetical protein [Candidatus Omnitrophota bacterium]
MKKNIFCLALLSLLVFLPLFSYAQVMPEAEAAVIPAASEKEIAQDMALAEADYAGMKLDKGRQRLDSIIAIQAVEEEDEPLAHEIDNVVRYFPKQSVNGADGKVRVTQEEFEYSYETKISGKLPIQFGLSTNYIGIDNSTNVKVPAHLTSVTGGIDVTMPFFNVDKTYFRFGLRPTAASDNWNFKASSFRLPGRAIVAYKPNEKLVLAVGFAVYPGYESPYTPFGGIFYKPNEKWTFNLMPENPTVSYYFNKDLSLFVEANMSNIEFKVRKDNLDNVGLAYKEKHLGLGFEYKLNKNIRGSISSGYSFGRSLKYRDSLGKISMKNGYYTEFMLQLNM